MKKYILIGLVIILSKLSFVYANSEQLKQLAGKMIYRDVPAQNETEFSVEFVGKPYQLIYYSNCLIELKDSEGATFVRYRSLWDDGNWKEYKENNKNEIRVLFHPRWYTGMEVCDILEGRGTIVGISNKIFKNFH